MDSSHLDHLPTWFRLKVAQGCLEQGIPLTPDQQALLDQAPAPESRQDRPPQSEPPA